MLVTTVDELENEGEPGWRIEQIIPESSIALLYAERGIGKSFLALDWFMCTLVGKAWCGREVRSDQAMYVVGESVSRMWPRVRAWKAHNHYEHGVGGRVVHGPIQFHRPAEVNALLRWIEDGEEIIHFILIDTFARCFIGGDEDRAQDVGMWIDGVDRVRRETGADVLVIHHAGWESKHERGSTALGGAADTVMRLRQTSIPNELVLHCEKQKDGPEFEDIRLTLTPHEDSCVLVPTSPEPDILATLVKLGGRATLSEWLRASGVSRATWFRHVRLLRDSGLVSLSGETYQVTPSPT